MQQHCTLPGCTEQLVFSLGINCGSNLKKLLLHPSNVSRHVGKPVHQPVGNQNTAFVSRRFHLSYVFTQPVPHPKQLFSPQTNFSNQGVHFFPTSLNSHLALSSLCYKLRKGAPQITSLSGWPVCAFHTLWPAQESCKIFLSCKTCVAGTFCLV